MKRKKIKFSPKLQSSSLDDIKRFVPKNALDTSVISNYNTLPTSYQNVGETDPSKVKQRRGTRINPDGSVSSHLMRAERLEDNNWVGFPSLFQDSKPYADGSVSPTF